MLKDLFIHAGWVAWPLGFCSVLAIAIVLERIFTLTRLMTMEKTAAAKLQTALANGNLDALNEKEIAAAPVTVILKNIVPVRNASEEAVDRMEEIGIAMQRGRLRRYLSGLATIGSTAPFIGLFGTVLGVLEAFQEMSKLQNGGGEAMAAHIGEALSATAVGLLVAIPAVICYNILLGRVQPCLLKINADVARLLPLLQEIPAAPSDTAVVKNGRGGTEAKHELREKQGV
jgi:biopolymer transport protein ExbB